jgi:hypothetical protein
VIGTEISRRVGGFFKAHSGLLAAKLMPRGGANTAAIRPTLDLVIVLTHSPLLWRLKSAGNFGTFTAMCRASSLSAISPPIFGPVCPQNKMGKRLDDKAG